MPNMAESVEFAGTFPRSQEDMGGWSASTAVESLHFRLENDGEVVQGYPYEDESNEIEESGPKRKRALSRSGKGATLKFRGRRSTSGKGSAHERQKITRACDACKTYDHLEPHENDPRKTDDL